MTVATTRDRLPMAPPWRPASPTGDDLLRHRLLEVLQAPLTTKLSYAEFLDWADEDTLAEWVEGEIIMTSPASNRHQDIAGFLASLLRIFAETHQLGQIRSGPFQMKLTASGREPDLLFIGNERLSHLKPTYLDGPADLAVEIISPESVGRDRGDKFYEYAQGGVPEYWLIDPRTSWAEFYHLEGARYRLVFVGAEGEYRSKVVPGFWLRVEWLWQEPLPAVEDVLLQIGGELYARRWIERLRQQGFLPGA